MAGSVAYNQQQGLMRDISSIRQQKARAGKVVGSMASGLGVGAARRGAQMAQQARPTMMQRVKRMTEWFKSKF